MGKQYCCTTVSVKMTSWLYDRSDKNAGSAVAISPMNRCCIGGLRLEV
ncbi:MAG: hypothetical protein IPL33_13425 [Sphingobacteriales bacterium]|nr:hypothetical protein [Sphingobacteriales bacterium]